MCFQDQSIEAKAKPVQELNCSDVGVLWVDGSEFFDAVKKKI